MKLSTQTSGVISRFGEDEGIKILAEAGYDALDYSMFMISRDPSCIWHTDTWREHAKELKEKAAAYGLAFNQGHAPFSYKFDTEGVLENVFMPDTLKSIEIAGILGIRDLVVHPLHHYLYKGNEDWIYEKNIEFYKSLIPYAEAAGVNISIENMWQRDPIRKYIVDDVGADEQELNSLVDDLNAYSNVFNVCLDLGHVVLVSRDPAEVIRNIGHDRLKALHVHDNDFIADKHTIMGQGKMDYTAIMQALSDIDYTGEFTLEADAFFANFKPDQIPMAARFMVDVSRYWMAKFDPKKN